jgi:hypothetical protein
MGMLGYQPTAKTLPVKRHSSEPQVLRVLLILALLTSVSFPLVGRIGSPSLFGYFISSGLLFIHND